MHITQADLLNYNRIEKSNLIQSLCGVRGVNLIGTANAAGRSNLAIFNSLMHLSSNPATMSFILRPHDKVRRDTYENILETGIFTVNHVHPSLIESAHYTSAKFDKEISEFEVCHLSEE